MSLERPLQELPLLTEDLEVSLLASQKSKRQKRLHVACLDAENTPQELIQNWSPPHKHPRVTDKGKENVFVLARRPRRRKDSIGACWDLLPDELLLRILSCLSLRDLLRTSRICKRWHQLAFDESLWQSVDLEGKVRLGSALGQVLSAGTLTLRCPHTSIGEPCFTHKEQLRVQHMDLSGCTVSPEVINDVISRCTQLQNLSLEGLVLSDGILQSIARNPQLGRLNLSGCSGFSSETLANMLQSCTRLTELNVSWCDFSNEHVKAVVSDVTPSISQLNISGYRQNLTMEDVRSLVERCPNIVNLDLSDSVLVTTDSFPVLQQLPSLRQLGLSRCYQIHPAALLDFERFEGLQTLEVFGLVQDNHLTALMKELPKLRINSQRFSNIARPSPSGRGGGSMWGLTCRLVYKL
ncbi:S-phase kinase-associated protein 2 [Clupea harengus]|uniref:S-phase kinase-associated protein 2 n=1 Tax=Clupea harengus TaxID=7950 RepID=A0A6P3VLM7_CLUHA|nr:S-phase kinase-associated protein 2 [Clupea harengus]